MKTIRCFALALLLVAPLVPQSPREVWKIEPVVQDVGRVQALLVAELLPAHQGAEVVLGTAEGRVRLLHYQGGRWSGPGWTFPVRWVGGAASDGLGGEGGAWSGGGAFLLGTTEDGSGRLAVVTGGEDGPECVTWSLPFVPAGPVCSRAGALFVVDDRDRIWVGRGGRGWRVWGALPDRVEQLVAGRMGVVARTAGGLLALGTPFGAWNPARIDGPGAVSLDAEEGGLLAIGEEGVVSRHGYDAWQAGRCWASETVTSLRVSGSARIRALGEGGFVVATGTGSLAIVEPRGRRLKESRYEVGALRALACGDVNQLGGEEVLVAGSRGVLCLRRDTEPLTGPQAGAWEPEVVLDLAVGFGGLAAGELDAASPGEEIVVVGRDGWLRMLTAAASGWKQEGLWEAPGEMIQVALGEVDPEAPGPEIVGVGMRRGRESRRGEGATVVVRRTAAGWSGEVIFVAPALQHGVCVHDGAIYTTGYDDAVHRLVRDEGGYRAEKVATLPGAGKNAVAVGGRIAIACTDGSVVDLDPGRDLQEVRVLDHRGAGRSRLGTDGRRLLVSDDDGTLSLLTPPEGKEAPWKRVVVHREFDRQRGAVLADLDPEAPGLEVATAGYEKKVTLLREVGGAWWGRMLLRESERFHHLLAADVDGEPGLELVACGYAGRVTVLRRRR